MSALGRPEREAPRSDSARRVVPSTRALPWLLAHVIGGQSRLHPLRALVQVVAIALGVALGYCVHLINTSALAEFGAAVRQVTGQADASIAGTREGFDEQVYARVLAHPAVELASPVLELDAAVVGAQVDLSREREAQLPIVGIDVLRAAALGVGVLPRPAEGAGRWALFDEGVFLSPAALARFGVAPGDTLRVQVGARVVALRIAGTVPGARAGQVLGVMDIGQAQSLLERAGRIQRIDLKLVEGADPQALARDLALPAGVALTAVDAAQTRISNLSRAYRVNLNVLALVALFTGAFLVFSLQAQATLARRTQLAFLRVLGVTRSQLRRLLVAEALALGTLGSLLGLALGALAARAALALFGGDLGGGFFQGAQPALLLAWPAALGFFALGVAAAVAGAWIPARDAARTAPAAALKAGAEEDALRPLGRAAPGLALLALAAGLVWLPPVQGVALAGYLAIVALLIGVIALQPRLAAAVFTPLAARLERSALSQRWPLLWLAASRIARAPGTAAIGLASVVASFALMVAMATMVASFRDSVSDWLDRVLPAELYARAGPAGSSSAFSEADLERIRSHPGVARVDFTRFVKASLDPARAPVTLIVRNIDAAEPARAFPLAGASRPWREGMDPPVWVSEAVVDLYDAPAGSTITLPIAGQAQRFFVAGVWRDYARQYGAIALRDTDYERLTGERARTDAAIWLAPGWSSASLAEELRGTLDARATAEFIAPGEIREASLKIFDRSFAVTYLLEIAAIVIGLTGVAASFSAQAIARSREFGMLRHLGLTRGAVLRLIALEGLMLTTLAVAVGLATGLAISLVLVFVVNPQSFHWTMDFHAPAGLIAVLVAALLAAATLTAVVAGRRATTRSAVMAVREDW
ncbi:MAG: hypothetical protein RL669_1411 [Pseudomonadota bacterium]